MSGKGSKEILEKLGVDMTARDMQVLKAVAEEASRNLEGVTYADISGHLNEKGVKLSKVWIYKCLSKLEDEGFILSERISNPRLYKTSQSIIADALEKKRKAKVDELKLEKEEVRAELESVKGTSIEDLTMMVYDTIVGTGPINSSTVIEGVENVRSILIKEFFQKAQKGDILRVIAPTIVVDRGGQTSGVTEMELLMKAAEGIELRTILVPTEDASRDPSLIAAYIGDLKDLLVEAIEGGSLWIRSPGFPLKTYRMVALNNDVMLLYLTHAPASDMAALVRRKDNPGLLNDALNTFDRIFVEGIDIAPMIRSLVADE